MPELPEVETICRGMALALTGRRVKAAEPRREGLRTPFPTNLNGILAGRRVQAVERRAKYIMMRLDDGGTLALHLGMSGRIVLPADLSAYALTKHDHLILSFDDGSAMVFNDPRRFGMVFHLAAGEEDAHPALHLLGPEPLADDFTPDVLAAALAARRCDIKAALLDQRVVAGLGNIYVCEALFQAGIDPQRPAHKVSVASIARLHGEIRSVLNKAIAAGGSTLKDYRRADGKQGYFQYSFSVYDREGQACPGCSCDLAKTRGIRRIVQGGRSSFFCPRRQT